MDARRETGRMGRTRGRRALQLEPLESRELLTFTMGHRFGQLSPQALAAIQARNAHQAAIVAQAQGSGSGADGNGGTSNGATGDTTGTPTPHEVARQTYVARFKGNFKIGPGRTSAQAAQLLSQGYGGGNQALHLWSNIRLTVPTDPTLPVSGVAYIVSWNVGTTGTQLILDLTGDRTATVNGFPTHYTWTVDPTSAGIYTNAAGFGSGQGTLDLHFFLQGRGRGAVRQTGQLQYSINGLIDTGGGVFNDLGVLGNIPKNP